MTTKTHHIIARWAILATFLVTGPLQALEFDVSYHDSIPSDMRDGIAQAMDTATAAWAAIFTDDTTIRIEMRYTASFPNPREGARATVYYLPMAYTRIRDKLIAEATSEADMSTIANLPMGDSLDFLINRTGDNPNGIDSEVPYLDDDSGENNREMRISLGNAKALGILPADFDFNDGKITISGSTVWDVDPTDGVKPGEADLVAVLLHEIGHILGMNTLIDGRLGANTGHPANSYAYVTPLDLFRYSEFSSALGVFDWSVDDREKYFSIDGGKSMVSLFSTGIFGDRHDPSHWKKSTDQSNGVFEPVVYPHQTIHGTDIMVLDVLGWDLNFEQKRPVELEITEAVMTETGLKLSWNPVEGAKEYRVYMTTDIDKGFYLAGKSTGNGWKSDGRQDFHLYYVEVSF